MKRNEQQEKLLEAYIESQKKINHLTVELGINEFKNMIRQVYKSKSMRNKLIASFKKRSWAEYHAVARDRGSFPTHNHKSHSVGVEASSEEFKVKVS